MSILIKIISLLFVYFTVSFNPIIFAEEVKIVFSHSLNGNLMSCPCAVVPVAGLSRRATFFQKNFSQENTIFLELGNFFSNSDSFEKRKVILEAFTKLGYTALIPSQNEWDNLTIADWKNLNREIILVSNLKEKGLFKSKNIFSERKLIIKKGKKFLIISLLSEIEFSKFPNSIKNSYEYISPNVYIQEILKKESFDYLVIIFISTLENLMREDFPSLKNAIFFLAPVNKITPQRGEIFTSKLGKIYTTSGKIGNEIGILKINLSLKSTQLQIIDLDVDNLEDSEMIKQIAEEK